MNTQDSIRDIRRFRYINDLLHNTKMCTKCEIIKPLSRFYKDSRKMQYRNKGYLSRCISCYKCISDSPENRERQKLHYNGNKDRAIDYLGGKCKDCDEVYVRDVYDFHHRSPKEKSFGIGEKLQGVWKILPPELDKCDLLCANCHRTRHHKERIAA